MKTAFITGATEGIGYELVQLFVNDGYHVIMVARNEKKLMEISERIKASGGQAEYYASDLSQIDNAKRIYDDLQRRQLLPDCVVNNAGFGTSGQFTEIDWQKEQEMMQLNMLTLAYFSKKFAHDMKLRGHGRLMNVASTAAFESVPYMAAYGATKAFVLSLSEALAFELKGSGVSVTTLCPGVTESKFHATAHTINTLQKAKLLPQANAADVAQYGYESMMKGKTLAVHKFGNRFNIFASRFLPRCIVTKLAASATTEKK